MIASVAAHSQTRPLNDSGIDVCGAATSGNNKPCLGTEPAGQDAHYGRDAQAAAGTLNKIGSGSKGFDFTALDASGNPTTPSSGANPHPCVRDNVTGLIWEVKTDDGGLHDKDWTYSWYNTNSPDGYPGTSSAGSCYQAGRCDTEKFIHDVNAAGWCGYADWRMPSVKELESIVDYGRYAPVIDPTYFINTPNSHFWSGTPHLVWSRAWEVDFEYGYTGGYYSGDRYLAYQVRLVRGGEPNLLPPSNPDSAYTIHGNGTVTDKRSGLMWKVCPEGKTWTEGSCTGIRTASCWDAALALAENSNFAGYNDWRLPNIKELRSLVDESRYDPAINTSIFPNSDSDLYWSSSPNINVNGGSWAVDFMWSSGSSTYARCVVGYAARLVRGGQPHDIPPTRLNPVFDTSIEPTPATNALLITHGYRSSADAWGREMAVGICRQYLHATRLLDVAVAPGNKLFKVCQASGWDVYLYDWQSGANTILPIDAWLVAKSHGEMLGKHIEMLGKQAGGQYEKVHLLAHSAGSNLINQASKAIKAEGAQVHLSFFDAFDPRALSTSTPVTYAGHISWYGQSADWADNYIDTRPLLLNIGGNGLINYDQTDLYLPRAYNIDVTPDIDGCDAEPKIEAATSCRHGRPYRFYGRSIATDYGLTTDSDSTLAHHNVIDPIGSVANMGFPFSQENGFTLPDLNQILPKGRVCRIDGNLCKPLTVTPDDLLQTARRAWDYVKETSQGFWRIDSGPANFPFSILLGSGNVVVAVAASEAPKTLTATTTTADAPPTESPSLLVMQVTTAEPVTTLNFDWRFASTGEGFLRVLVDDVVVRDIDQRYVGTASRETEKVYIGGSTGYLAPGTHRVAFRLDGYGASAAAVQLSNVEFTATLANGWSQSTGTTAAWAVASDSAQSGGTSLKSATIQHNESTGMSYTGMFAAGTVSFARRVSSETNYDFLRFYIDGVQQAQWSGEVPWSAVSFPVTAGVHELKWIYVKNGSISSGSDAAWIDSVTLPLATSPDTPTLNSIVPSNGSMRLNFTPSTTSGGLAITGYVATCIGGGSTYSATGSTSPITVTGLTNRVRYTCSVQATNAVGNSPVSTSLTKVAGRPSIAPFLNMLLD